MFRRALYVAVDWLPFYEVDWTAMKVKNQVAHLALDYQWARAKIAKARRYLESVEAYTENEFEKRKKLTLDKTTKAVADMKVQLHKEEADANIAYNKAMKVLSEKKHAVDEVIHTISSLGSQDYPLR